jgi:hypothetical protein
LFTPRHSFIENSAVDGGVSRFLARGVNEDKVVGRFDLAENLNLQRAPISPARSVTLIHAKRWKDLRLRYEQERPARMPTEFRRREPARRGVVPCGLS